MKKLQQKFTLNVDKEKLNFTKHFLNNKMDSD